MIAKINMPLLLRLLEYAKEDAKSDIDLHLLIERLEKLDTTLTMEHYSYLVGEENGQV